jgi:hypothetical protein
MWVALDLIADRLDSSGLEQPEDLWRGKVGKAFEDVSNEGSFSDSELLDSPIYFVFPISTSLSMACQVISKDRESPTSITGWSAKERLLVAALGPGFCVDD